tara:strand:- start:65120 stop:65590 length:471 start_codon:yes stop_codon:yes gene_type:complete
MEQDETVQELIAQFGNVPGGLLPLLHALQAAVGYIPPESVPAIARGLHLSRAEVHGVLSFYHDFLDRAPARHVLQICRAEACQAMGSRELEAHAKQRLGVDYGQLTADGELELQAVYCLGNCACSPSIRIDNAIHARVDAARLDALLDKLSAPEGS